MLHEKFGQMALILPDVCESYWPYYACPVFLGHSLLCISATEMLCPTIMHDNYNRPSVKYKGEFKMFQNLQSLSSGLSSAATQSLGLLTGRSHGINKLSPWQRAVAAAVLLSEQIGSPKAFSSQPISTSLAPLVEVKTVAYLLLQRQRYTPLMWSHSEAKTGHYFTQKTWQTIQYEED